MDEYAIVLDQPRQEVVLLRDSLRTAAESHFKRAEKAKSPTIRRRNYEKAEILTKYADRCDEIRKDQAREIAEALRASQG
jgi:hypothetical protein